MSKQWRTLQKTSLKIQLPLATVISENGISMTAHSRSAMARLHRNKLVRVRMPRLRRTTTITSELPSTAPHIIAARLSVRPTRQGTVQYGGCGNVEFDGSARSHADVAVSSTSPDIDVSSANCVYSEQKHTQLSCVIREHHLLLRPKVPCA